MINTLSKINLSKIGWEGGRSTSIFLNILFVFFESTPKIAKDRCNKGHCKTKTIKRHHTNLLI